MDNSANQLATAVLAEVLLPLDELESELDDVDELDSFEPLSDFAGSLAVDAPPRLSVR